MATEDAIYSDGQPGFPTTPEEHKKLLDWALRNFDAADRARQDHEKRWRRFYKLYRSYSVRKTGDWHSRVFLPICFYVVETIIPKLVAQLPKMLVNPVSQDDEDPADLMEQLLEWAADRSGLYEELVSAYRSAMKYGTGVIKTYHDVEKRTRMVQVPVTQTVTMPAMPAPQTGPDGQPIADMNGAPLMDPGQASTIEVPVMNPDGTPQTKPQPQTYEVYNGPKAEAIDIFSFWPAPEATSIADARYVIHQSFRDNVYVTDLVKKGIFKLPPDMDVKTLWDDKHTEPHLSRQSEIGDTSSTDPTRHKVELLEFWTDTAVMTIANRIAVVRVQDNPFAHGEKPFVRVLDHYQEHEFWGVGEIEPLEGTQDAINAIWNQRIDNIRIVMNRAFVADVSKLQDVRDLQLKPGSVIRINADNAAIGDIISPIEFPDVTSSAYQETSELERFTEKVSGVSAYQTGTDGPQLNDTATGVALISEQGNSRFALKVRMAELTGLTPLARQFGSILQQFSPAEMVIRIEGPEGQWEWAQVTQEGIQGALDYDIEAESSTVTESLRKEQAMSLFQLALTAVDPSTGVPVFKVDELGKDLLKQMGKKNLERYLTPPPVPPQIDPATGQPIQPGMLPQGMPPGGPMLPPGGMGPVPAAPMAPQQVPQQMPPQYAGAPA